MAGTTVFGRPTTSSVANAVLGAASMNPAPSPSQPEHAPADGISKRYAQLWAIASAALREETDLGKRIELERIVSFADSALTGAVEAAGSGGAPVPNIPMPPPPPAAPAPGAPPAAPAGGAPGPAAGPTLPGAPA